MAQGVDLSFRYHGMNVNLSLVPQQNVKSEDKPAPKRRGRPPGSRTLKKVA